MLKFYRRYLKSKQSEVLFVAAKTTSDFENLNIELCNITDTQILLTDIKDASASLNLLEAEEESTIRYIDYSSIYDDITKKTYKVDEI